MTGDRAVAVYLEMGKRRVFACALDWPGWCRVGVGEAGALAALADYGERYAAVARRAGIAFPGAASGFRVVERLTGTASSVEFGVPGAIAAADREPWSAAESARQRALLQAAWATLDQIAAESPPTLRKGPRGGGRDRDAIMAHVLGPEAGGYARSLGLKLTEPAVGDPAAIAAHRAALLTALAAPAPAEGGEPPTRGKRWPPRYAVRRLAWHILDHAWEIEDRSAPA